VTKAEILRRHVLELIDGSMAPHDKLPTERDLAEQFSVARLTVRQVLGKLENEGRVYREQGSGTFVSEPRIQKSLELTSFSEDMRSRGLRPGSLATFVERKPAGASVGASLQMSPRDEVIHIHRVRTADEVPICIEESYIPADLAPGIVDSEIDGSLYDLLQTRFHVRLDRAEQTIRVTTLEPREAALLGTAEFSPAFDVRRVGIDSRGRHVEYAQSIYRGDRYSYDLTVYRTLGGSDELTHTERP
jgi:GntR family transcriptional regulator